MRYFFAFILLHIIHISHSQVIETEVFCEEEPVDFPLNEKSNEAYDQSILELFLKAPEGIKETSWDWVELGPLGTPEEGTSSKALPEYSHGRGNGTGRINKLYVSPANANQIFACSPAGGLFYSTNKGVSWQTGGTDQLVISGVSSVIVNPSDSKNWIITTGDGDGNFIFSNGVYKTYDSGDSWEKMNGTINNRLPILENSFDFYISKIEAHPCEFNKQFLCTNKGLFKSVNASSSAKKVKWQLISKQSFYDVEISELDETLVAAGGENLWLSSNCGKSWHNVGRPTLEGDVKYDFHRMSIEFSRENPSVIFVACTRKKSLNKSPIGAGMLYEYNLDTDEWKEISSLKKYGNLIPSRARAFELSPYADSILLIGNVKPIRRSEDRGKTFDKITENQMHDDVHDFEFLGNELEVLAAHDGGVSYSSDGGFSWQKRDAGIGAANVHGISVGQTMEDMVLYGGYDTGCTLLKDGTWKHVSFGDGFETIIHQDDSSRMIVSMQNGKLYSETVGKPGFNERITMKNFKASWHTWIQPNPTYPNILYKSGKTVARSLDFGKSWEEILVLNENLNIPGKIWRVYMTDGFPDVLFGVVLGKTREEDRLCYSDNVNESDPNLINWSILPKCPKNGWVESILKTGNCESCHVISFNSFSNGKKVYEFNGSSYRDISEGIGFSAVRSGVRDQETGRIYLGTKQGLFTKSPTDSVWELLTGLPGARIRSLDINYVTEEIYIGTFGRGIWKGKLMR